MSVIYGEPVWIGGGNVAFTAPRPEIVYTDGLSGLSAEELNAMAKAISRNSAITNRTTEVWVHLLDKRRHVSVGNALSIALGGSSYAFTLMGFNHYALTSDTAGTAYGETTETGKAGLLFQMTNCWGQKMRRSEYSNGRFDIIATFLRDTLTQRLSSGMRSVCKTVVSANPISVQFGAFLLPREKEVFGANVHSRPETDAQQYCWYYVNSAQSDRIKRVNGTPSEWWLGSLYKDSTDDRTLACYVAADGGHYVDTDGLKGVSPCFCI